MQRHIKEYFDKMGLDPSQWQPCEICGRAGNSVHHIKLRSSFGSKRKNTEPGNQDHIDNLILLCQEHHDLFHNASGRALLQEKIDAAIKARKLNIGLI